ncbi:MAG: TauD/TfdA dioxygenase family protein, partial [Acidimicrobiales bacterium]
WSESAPFRRISVDKATPTIRAYVCGVDLSDADDETVAEIRRALNENCVLFFRDQKMTPDQHVGFGRRFGDLDIHPAAQNSDGHREILVIHADENSARANGEEWHSDVSCLPEPPMGSILHMHKVPPAGGDTMFSSMPAAYDALSDRMKGYLDGLTAVHDGAHVYGAADFSRKDTAEYPRAEHPVVRTHPESGRKCLFVNRGFTTRIVGVPRDESDAILDYLYRHMEHPNFQVRFSWQPGSVAFWDNRSAQHRPIWDYWPHRRTGHRVTVKGDRPF